MLKNNIKNIFDIKTINILFKSKDTIFTNLQKYIKPDSKLLLAVSGWADSILMSVIVLDYFWTNQLDTNNIYFIHLNHKTRASNTQDEKFIKSFFDSSNLIIETRKNNLSKTENNLRNRRYQQIQKHSQKNKIDFILFGHNLTDRIESSFMNMLRWCSLQWLQSMLPIQDHHLLKNKVIRPLIQLSKSEIFQICKKNQIPYVQDETNDDPKTSLRNKIRIKILPQIFDLSHKKTQTSNSFIQSFQKIYNQLDEDTNNQDILNDINKSPYRNCKFWYEIDIYKKLISQEQIVSILKKLWIYKNINTKFINDLKDFITTKDDWFKYFNQTYFWVSHSKVFIINAPQKFWTKSIDKKVSIDRLWYIILWKIKVYINDKKFVWSILRFPKSWDKFKNKTRNQYCINQKIPVIRRNFIPVVENNWDIIHAFKDIYNL